MPGIECVGGLGRLRHLSAVLATGTALGSLVFPSGPARADCQQTGSTVTCSGADVDGFTAGAQNSLAVTVQSGATVSNPGAVVIQLNNSNTLDNFGTVTGSNNNVVISAGDNNLGSGISNFGTISVGNSTMPSDAVGIEVGSTNVVSNTSLIQGGSGTGAHAAVYGIRAASSNIISNTGTIQLGDATVAQSGVLGIFALSNNVVTNSGAIQIGNSAGGSALAAGIYVGDSFNQVTNVGSITVGDNGFGIHAGDGNNSVGGITNTGTIVVGNASVASSNSTGIQVGANNIVNNTGRIQVGNATSANAFVTGLQTGASNVVTNSGQIQVGNAAVVSSHAIGITVGDSTVLTNSGSVTVGDASFTNASATAIQGGSGGHITNTGTITVGNATGFASGRGIAVDASNVIINNGTISLGSSGTAIETFQSANAVTNNGLIVVGANGQGMVLNGDNDVVLNAGTIRGGQPSSGISSGNGSAITNTGAIELANGIGVSTGNSAVVTNNGAIRIGDSTVNSSSVGVQLLFDGNLVNNSGVIALGNAAAATVVRGVYMRGDTNTLNNSGAITVGNALVGTTSGVYVEGNGATITNTGRIAAGDATVNVAIGIEVAQTTAGAAAQINNSGTISVGASVGATAQAIRIHGVSGSSVTIDNAGTIKTGQGGYSLLSQAVDTVTVSNTGTLDGNIFLAGISTVTNSGLMTIDAGSTPNGLYFINGGFQQSASGVLSFRVSPTGNDQMIVNAANLDGTLRAAVQPGLYANTQTYANVVAAGALTGSFAQAVSTSPFFTAIATNNGTNVDLTLNRVAFNAAPGLNANQQAVGSALEAGYSTGVTGKAATLYGNLLGSTQGAGATFSQLSGEGITQAQQSAFFSGNMFMSAMLDQGLPGGAGAAGGGTRLGFASETYDDAADALAYAPGSGGPVFKTLKAPPGPPPSQWRIWTGGFGGRQSIDGDANVGSADSRVSGWGGVLGVERQSSPWLRYGFAVGASESSFSVSDRDTTGSATGGHFGVYGTYSFGASYLAGVLSYSHFANKTTRTVNTIGLSETLDGKFGSDQIGTRLEYGYRMAWRMFNVTPFAAVQYSYLRQQGFDETASTGGGVLALSVAQQNQSSLPVFIGAQLDSQYMVGGMALAPYIRAAWVHEFKPDRNMTAAFVSIPSASFTVDGARPASDSAKLDLGATLAVSTSTSLFGNVTSEFSSRGQTFAGMAGAKFAW